MHKIKLAFTFVWHKFLSAGAARDNRIFLLLRFLVEKAFHFNFWSESNSIFLYLFHRLRANSSFIDLPRLKVKILTAGTFFEVKKHQISIFLTFSIFITIHFLTFNHTICRKQKQNAKMYKTQTPISERYRVHKYLTISLKKPERFLHHFKNHLLF
jgi:hypothetical protein